MIIIGSFTVGYASSGTHVHEARHIEGARMIKPRFNVIRHTVFLGVVAVGFVPIRSGAQTLMDSIRGLKRTAEQLTSGVSRAPRQVANPSGATADAPTDDLVASEFLAVDTSDTSLESQQTAQRQAVSFDVRGLRLGMSPREINRVGRRIGARRDPEVPSTSGDFGVEATRLANQGLGRPVSDRSRLLWRGGRANLKNGGELRMRTELEASGPKLSELSYRTSLEGQSPAEFRQAVIAKYGQPDATNVNGGTTQMLWCSKALPANPGPRRTLGETTSDCDKIRLAIESYVAAPFLAVSFDRDQAWFTLNRGKEYRDAVSARMTARADEIRRGTGRKAQF